MSTQTKDRPGLSWKEGCEDPNLQDRPYKIETNDRGQIVMSLTYYRVRPDFRNRVAISKPISQHVISSEVETRAKRLTK